MGFRDSDLGSGFRSTLSAKSPTAHVVPMLTGTGLPGRRQGSREDTEAYKYDAAIR